MPERKSVWDLRQCDVTTVVRDGPHQGRLYCNQPAGHPGGWHHMCHPGTNYFVFFLIPNATVSVVDA